LFVEFVECWFLSVKPVACSFFSSWNLYIDFSPHGYVFVRETWCVLISFVKLPACWFFSLRENCTLIFLFVKPILFMEHVRSWFLFVELFSCLILFVKLVICSFFSSCNLQIDIYARETSFVHGSYCELIVVRGTCCMPIFGFETCYMLFFLFMKHNFSPREVNFDYGTFSVLILLMELVACWFSSTELVVCWFFLRETFTLIF